MIPDSTSEPPNRRNLYKHAATFCLLAPFIGYAVSFGSVWYLVTHRPQSQLGAFIHVALGMAPFTFGILGFIFGIIALSGIRRNGATGILGKVLMGFVICLLVSIIASQHFHEALVEISWQPPTILAQKIAKADRVVISREGEASISRTGAEAAKIVDAVSGARRDAENYTAVFGVHLEFYLETNLLATIRWQGNAFLTDEGQFSDNSGELNLLYHKLFMQ